MFYLYDLGLYICYLSVIAFTNDFFVLSRNRITIKYLMFGNIWKMSTSDIALALQSGNDVITPI